MAVDTWQTAPIHGHGMGSFALLVRGVDTRVYPHNILLETSAELGTIGAILLIMLFVYPGLRLLRGSLSTRRPETVLILAILAYTGANAMISGDLGSSRLLFVTIGLAAIPLLDES